MSRLADVARGAEQSSGAVGPDSRNGHIRVEVDEVCVSVGSPSAHDLL